MKILFVEDNDGFADDLRLALSAIDGVSSIDRVIDKQSAAERLADGLVDLIILDLSIPPSPDSDAPVAEHGQALFHEARASRPGTPIFILTGEEVERFSRGLAKYGNQVRLWGATTTTETVSFFLKEEVRELLARVQELATSFSLMDAITINTRGKQLGMTPIQTQMLKTFARTADGIACDLSLLHGGLSDAKVVKATAMDLARRPQAICAGKLGPSGVIETELLAYERHVRKLGIGACPPIYCSITDGVGQHGAIFYTLTDDDTLSLFERLSHNSDLGAIVVGNVRTALQRWSEAATADMVPLSEIRARMIDDQDADAVSAKFGIEKIRAIESKQIHISKSCIHGDLHCGNVLVKSDGGAVLIDFGDAGAGFTCLDPIALELSLIFHPDAKKFGLRNGLIDHLEKWPNIDAFAESGPLKKTIVACREWSHDVGGSDQAVLACAYAYAIRQLKYDTVDPAVTLVFLSVLAERLAAS